MFLKNLWQVAAFSAELKDAPLARTLLGEEVVLFRDAAGAPVALLDECPHRLAPLSLGKVVDGALQCGYHGMRFDAGGACVHAPGQDRIPSKARVRSFPVVERHAFVWIWMGDPAAADDALVPDFFWMEDPAWAISEGYHHVAANYQLLNDNLLDLSHETFVHSHTIGNAAVADSPLTVTLDGERTVRAHRDMLNCEPPPFYVKAAGFTGRIDRWHTTIFTPPAFHVIENGSMPAGSDKEEARRNGLTRERRVLNLITPETEASSHYFWAIARCYALKDRELTDYIRVEVARTFDEDKLVLEAQQRRMKGAHFDTFPVTLRADAGAVQARRMLARLLAEQAADEVRPRPALQRETA
ncbi:MAG TPA: aromatic ring-hydroxylating dioxygenase subunit alpha [Beijerinckiaceae bacterium]|jgi:vanillate O-demethylase monooxygenase subunit